MGSTRGGWMRVEDGGLHSPTSDDEIFCLRKSAYANLCEGLAVKRRSHGGALRSERAIGPQISRTNLWITFG
jgi:hypothetical protein